jgi:hypothetical protein
LKASVVQAYESTQSGNALKIFLPNWVPKESTDRNNNPEYVNSREILEG